MRSASTTRFLVLRMVGRAALALTAACLAILTAAPAHATRPGQFEHPLSSADTPVGRNPQTGGKAPPQVTVAGLQYRIGPYNAGDAPHYAYANTPREIAVVLGSYVTFKVVPSTTTEQFPAGSPTWDFSPNDAQANSDGTETVHFQKPCLDVDMPTSVSATCGQTSTCKVLVVDISAACTIPTLLPVTIPNVADPYPSGVIAELLLLPGAILVHDVKVYVGGADATVTCSSQLYDPSDGHTDAPGPYQIAISPRAHCPYPLMLEQALIAGQIHPGNFQQEITIDGVVSPSGTDPLPLTWEITPTVTVAAPKPAAASGEYDGVNHDGPYVAQWSPNHCDEITFSVDLPDTGPATATMIQKYTGDEAYIYSGGDAVRYGGGLGYADVGVQLGHTGNAGWLPYFAVKSHPRSGRVPPERTGRLAPIGVLVPAGQTTMTFETPGYVDPVYGPVAAGKGRLIITSAAAKGAQTYPVPLRTAWDIDKRTGTVRVKYSVSIGQDLLDNAGPPHPPANAPPGNNTAGIYTSGSFLLGTTITAEPFHFQQGCSGAPPPVQKNPGGPYVSALNLYTLRQ